MLLVALQIFISHTRPLIIIFFFHLLRQKYTCVLFFSTGQIQFHLAYLYPYLHVRSACAHRIWREREKQNVGWYFILDQVQSFKNIYVCAEKKLPTYISTKTFEQRCGGCGFGPNLMVKRHNAMKQQILLFAEGQR